jgi:hypothetical protein
LADFALNRYSMLKYNTLFRRTEARTAGPGEATIGMLADINL